VFGQLIVHQRVIEAVSDELTVLPARLGTVLASEDEVRMLLERFGQPLAAALKDVAGAVEVDLSATWDTNALFADIAREPAVAALAGAVAEENSDDDVAARVRVGMAVQEAAEQRRETYRRRIVGELVSHTRDAQPNPSVADDIVANLALLVDRAKLADFDAAVDELGQEMGDVLSFRYVGPLPPYSFATVDVVRPAPQVIEHARQMLELGEHSSLGDVHDSYRRLAAAAHPDRNPSDREAQERFSVLTSARDILTEFMRGQPPAVSGPDSGHLYDLTPESVARSLVLQIRRSDAPPSSLHQSAHESAPSS
jgi:Gas vesicle synthesis protein GvpL/GvpF/DnaJ domain